MTVIARINVKPATLAGAAVDRSVILATIEELDAYVRALLDEHDVPIVYVAHPVSGDVGANIKAAFGWMEWLLRRWPRVAWIAPWIVDAHVLDDGDELDREAGLVRDEAVVGLVDALLLVGGRVSAGMERERAAALLAGAAAIDFTAAGARPPRL